jgi:hypothetical protein
MSAFDTIAKYIPSISSLRICGYSRFVILILLVIVFLLVAIFMSLQVLCSRLEETHA